MIFEPERCAGKEVKEKSAVDVSVGTVEVIGTEQPDAASSTVPDFVAQPFAFLQVVSGDESVEIAIRESDVDWLSRQLGVEIARS